MKNSLEAVAFNARGYQDSLKPADWLAHLKLSMREALRMDNTLTFKDIEELIGMFQLPAIQDAIKHVCKQWIEEGSEGSEGAK